MANKIQLIIEADDQASTKFKRMVTSLERGITSVDSETKRLDRSANSLGNTLKWAGGIMATYFGVRAFTGIVRGVIDTTAGFEQMRIQLDTLTRGKGQETLDALNQWAKDMPVNTEKAVEAFIRMKAMGLDPTIEDMTTLVDTTSALGGDSGTLEGISRALGQIQTKGKVSAEELLQLAERGVPAYRILQEQLGLTADQVANIGKEGISGTEAVRALLRGMAEEFGGQSARMQDTWIGMVEALRSEWVDFQKEVGEAGGLDSFKSAVQGILETIRELERDGTLQAWAQALGQSMATAIKWAQDAIRFWSDFFGIGPAVELKNVRTELDNLTEQLKQGGVEFISVGETMVEVGHSTEELQQKIAALKERERELIDTMQERRLALPELTDAHTEATDIEIDNITRKNEAEIEALEKLREAQEDYEKVFEKRWIDREKMWLKGTAQWRKNEEKRRKEEEKRETQLFQFKSQMAHNWLEFAQNIGNTLLALSKEQSGALFYVTRAFAFAQALVSAFAAHNRALMEIPYPPNPAFADAVLALGLSQAAAIAATTFTGHAKGGWIHGGSGVRDDLYIGTIGQTAHLAQGGEFIVNREAARANAGLLEDINEGRATSMPVGESEITLHNYITVELEGETLGQFVDTRVYEQSKAGARIVHRRGIVT